jgi:hypothetical protein
VSPAPEETVAEQPVAPAEQSARPFGERPLAHILLAAVLAVVGLELGFLGGFLALRDARVAGVTLPVGVILAVVVNALVARWVVRAAPAGYLLLTGGGWAVAALALDVKRPEGDLVYPDDPHVYAFLLLGSLAFLVPLLVALVRGASSAAAPPR